MNKFLSKTTVFILLISILCTFTSGIAAKSHKEYSRPNVYVDGTKINYRYENGTTANAFMSTDWVTYMPVRAIAEAFGKNVTTNGANIYITSPDNVADTGKLSSGYIRRDATFSYSALHVNGKTHTEYSHPNVYVDGVKIDYKYENGTTANAFMSTEWVTYMPVRALAEALNKLVTPTGTNISIVSPESLLADGEYIATFYKDLIYTTDEGLRGFAVIKDYITFDDVYVKNLKIGDTLPLSGLSLNGNALANINVDRIKKINNNAINIDWTHSLVKNKKYSSDFWVLTDDISIDIHKYDFDNLFLSFTKDAIIIDNLSYAYGYGVPEMRVDNIKALFNSPYVKEREDLYITIKDGKVVDAILYYHP